MVISSRIRKLSADCIMQNRLDPVAERVQASLSRGSEPEDAVALNKLLEHAQERVPHYRGCVGSELKEFPVVTKNDMRENLENFLDKETRLDKLASASTSGSTGVPFTAYFDRRKVLQHRAGVVGSYRYMGVDPYGAFVYSRAWGVMGVKQRTALRLKGQLPYAGVHQDVNEPEQVVRWINQRKNVAFIGYSSYIEALLRTIETEGLEIKANAVGAVVGGSEPATGYMTVAAERLFGLRPHMRYSNMELGIIAVTGTDPSVYHIDTSSYFVEILREDSNQPQAPGELGRIVVTDLYNTAMPFIRYDTGDLGQFVQDAWGRVQSNLLTNIQGRRLDTLVGGTEDAPRKLHSLQIWGPTSKLTELRQFQLRQHAIGRFTWILNAKQSQSLERQLRKILTQVVGPVKECNFEYVDSVPELASGKRQFFVTEIPVDGL